MNPDVIDKLRAEEVSKDFRDDYTALSLSNVSYTMLMTTCIACNDNETADLANQVDTQLWQDLFTLPLRDGPSSMLKPPSSKVKKQPADQPTEEFDLDSGRVKGPRTPQKGQKFEVSSDPDIKIKPPKETVDSGSEFELSLTPDSSDEFDLKLSDDDSDEVQIGTMPRGVKAGDSGINLQAPADSGISLEDKSSSSEFELPACTTRITLA